MGETPEKPGPKRNGNLELSSNVINTPVALRAGVCLPGGVIRCGGGGCAGGPVGAPEGGGSPLNAGGAQNPPEAGAAGCLNGGSRVGLLSQRGGLEAPPAAGGNDDIYYIKPNLLYDDIYVTK